MQLSSDQSGYGYGIEVQKFPPKSKSTRAPSCGAHHPPPATNLLARRASASDEYGGFLPSCRSTTSESTTRRFVVIPCRIASHLSRQVCNLQAGPVPGANLCEKNQCALFLWFPRPWSNKKKRGAKAAICSASWFISDGSYMTQTHKGDKTIGTLLIDLHINTTSVRPAYLPCYNRYTSRATLRHPC